MTSLDPHVVVLGGGTGCPTILKGLHRYITNLSAVVTVMDSGGSSGRLRKELGIPALGDLRRCLVAMSNEGQDRQTLSGLLEYRFNSTGVLGDHCVGNLLLLALVEQCGDLVEALELLGRQLSIVGKVLPVTVESVSLCAVLEDGNILYSESEIDLRGPSSVGIQEIYLDPVPKATPQAIQAIQEAQAIVFGPGDLYTSLLPILLVDGISEAIKRSSAQKVFVSNLTTKPGETDNFKLSDFMKETLRYLETDQLFDAIIVNDGMIPNESIQADLEACSQLAHELIVKVLADSNHVGRHDPDITALAILESIR
ncbi:YvcK family protein [SAR202 cluster bacterium AD-802-E10_MRT_200m]|nr:YvcK family protein [SAR202 cluster bacterium AD-802-E10_MRT_200m]